MKKIILLGVLISFFGCKKAIKNEANNLDNKELDSIQFVEPQITDSKEVNSANDLLGYWVGVFEADMNDEQRDSLYKKLGDRFYNDISKKVTFSFDKIKADSIFGHTIVSGNITSFKGIITFEENTFEIKVKEPNKSKNDGFFMMNVVKNDTLIQGTWSGYSPRELKIPNRKYELHKVKFEYNPKNKIEYTFRDKDKSKLAVFRDTIDGEPEEYDDTTFYSTTEKVFDKNASTTLLNKAFVSNLTKADIYILRNSIFARHGYAFRDRQLRIYFEYFEWYMPVFGDVKKDLTDLEKNNVALLLRYEKNAEEYYDTFGR